MPVRLRRDIQQERYEKTVLDYKKVMKLLSDTQVETFRKVLLYDLLYGIFLEFSFLFFFWLFGLILLVTLFFYCCGVVDVLLGG